MPSAEEADKQLVERFPVADDNLADRARRIPGDRPGPVTELRPARAPARGPHWRPSPIAATTPLTAGSAGRTRAISRGTGALPQAHREPTSTKVEVHGVSTAPHRRGPLPDRVARLHPALLRAPWARPQRRARRAAPPVRPRHHRPPGGNSALPASRVPPRRDRRAVGHRGWTSPGGPGPVQAG